MERTKERNVCSESGEGKELGNKRNERYKCTIVYVACHGKGDSYIRCGMEGTHNLMTYPGIVRHHATMLLDEISNVHGHLVNLRMVKLLNVFESTDVIGGEEVDGDTLAPETTTTTNAVNVVFAVCRQIVVDDE